MFFLFGPFKIYETVNQKKVFKTLKRGQPKEESST